MASQPSTAGLAQDLTCKVQELERELTEARRQLAATGEILRLISRSPTDVGPVFDAIIASAVKLCGAHQGAVYRYDGNLVHLGAHRNYAPEIIEILRRMYPRPPQLDQVSGRAILSRAVAQIEDMRSDQLYSPELTVAGAWRSQLAVPMFRDEMPIGAIVIARPEAGAFSESHIELLKTFAEQAVIAIENARLFEAEQASKRELAEALEYQTATSEVLGVISKSPNSVHPVFEAIITMAERLCGGDFGFVYRLENDGNYHLVAVPRASESYRTYRAAHPVVPGDESIMGRALLERRAIHVADVKHDPQQTEIEAHRRGNIRSALAAPLINVGKAIGVMGVVRSTARPFSPRQVALIETFADQAVIAIENARLFEEVQARTQELTESLQYQTATSDVLNVISRSKFDRQPVFEAIVASGLKLFFSDAVLITLPEGDVVKTIAVSASDPARADAIKKRFPVPLTRDYMHGIAILDHRVVDIPDANSVSPELSTGAQAMLASGNQAITIVPLMRGEKAIGALSVLRLVAGPLSPKQLELLETFADQAVIAIENARLFEEVQARNRDLIALGEVGRAVSSTLDLDVVLKTIVDRAVDLSNTDAGSIYYYREQVGHFELGQTAGLDGKTVARFRTLDITSKG